ncbi:ABC transporter substrate-binding protein [Halorussus sp. MSC15.2]|uniref:ABC transporter substrate-binding protein n=1 Tax=Halorussus sp. MSC15.2 TaxID=2283638 RepID=UPI0013D7CCA5|nr:extracellular solute-binding protein [Halorussus sp. MSC15.2]NEU56844.1 extracellular solute-binding protein [Halorussus sp. MSC15.2]
MTDANEGSDVSRRDYLKVAGAGTIGVTGLAGCMGGGGDGEATTTEDESTTESDGSDEETTTEQATDYNKLEVQHWWTGGDGNKAVTALFEGFKEKHPDIEVNQNPVPGGGGQNLKTVIKKRVLNNDPPSSWQAWPGAHLQPFVDADKLKDIGDSVWSKNGMKSAYKQGPKDAAKPGGKFVTVPLNIHRLNNLFFNKSVVEEAGVDPLSISKPSDVVAAMKKVENNTDAVGMAHQTKSAWSTSQLWAQVLLGEYGKDTYVAFTEGKVEENKEAIKDSLSIVKKYKNYFNDDAGSISWTEANKKIINGEAAFFHQGDWAAGMYRSQDGFEFESEWGQVPFPGTDGIYALNMDSFPFPKNNPSPKATKKFLQYCGSVDAQERFNPKKGSIPPRTDVPKDKFGPFLSRQMDEFANSEAQVKSIEHGLALPPEIKSNYGDAMSTFTSNWNVDKTYEQLKQAFN